MFLEFVDGSVLVPEGPEAEVRVFEVLTHLQLGGFPRISYKHACERSSHKQPVLNKQMPAVNLRQGNSWLPHL